MEGLDFSLERDELGERFGGSLPRGSLIVIEGEEGAGKSVLAERLSYGLVSHGNTVSFVTTELTMAGFLDQMESLRYDVWASLLEERMVVIPAHPLLASHAPRHETLDRLLGGRRLFRKEVIVLDCFSKMLADHERFHGPAESRARFEDALDFFKRLNGLGKTVVLTFETGETRPEVSELFKEAADVFLTLRFEVIGNAAQRRIVVNRLSRARGRFGDVIGYRVEAGIGIVIEIKSVV